MNPFGQLARERLLLLIRLEGFWGIGQERFSCYVGEELQKLQESISVYLVSKFQMSMWVFPQIVVPPFHTPKWSFLVGKPWLLGTKTPLQLARPRRPMRPSVNSWPRPWAKKSPRRPPCAFLFEVFSAAIVSFKREQMEELEPLFQPGERLWNIRKNNHPSSARKDIEWWIMIHESIKWSMNLCKTLNVSM